MMENMEKVKDEAYKAAKEILEKAKLEKGDLFVVGCSTSEVCGETIGTHSKPELADMVFGGIYEATQEYSVYLAAQCCEHLNRALILEKDAARKYGYPIAGSTFPNVGLFPDADEYSDDKSKADCQKGNWKNHKKGTIMQKQIQTKCESKDKSSHRSKYNSNNH